MEFIGNNYIRKLVNQALDYLFPRQCLNCQKEGEYLCSACFDKIEYLDETVCFLCQKPGAIDGLCPGCQSRSGIDKIIVAGKYHDSVLGQAVEQLKYQYLESLATKLAESMAVQVFRQNFQDILTSGAIVPIPLHKKRLAERGFNQAELIARELNSFFPIKVELNLLNRTKSTGQQAKLKREERLENMQEAFIINPTWRADVPESVILIDDVLTTGATFIEATQPLKNAGVKNVYCLAVCHG